MATVKILYVIDTLEVGGAERSLLEITRRLDRSRFTPVVCHLYAGDALRREFDRADVLVTALAVPNKYHFLTGIRSLCRVIDRERPALIHTTLFRSDQVGRIAGRLKRVPVVSSLVNVSYGKIRLRDNPHLTWWKLRALQALDIGTARLVHRFHAVAESVARDNAQQLWISPRKITVVPRGRDLSRFSDVSPPDATGGRTGDGPNILSVGRLIDQKGHKYLLQAWPRVLQQYPRAELRIAGSGWLAKDLERLSCQLGIESSVRFLGQRDDIAELLQAADVFVFPSLYEGLPGAVIEAMLTGRAIVASDLPVTRELINDSVDGRLVPPTCPHALADAMLDLLGNRELRSKFGQRVQQKARERFDIKNIVGQMERLYSEALPGLMLGPPRNPRRHDFAAPGIAHKEM